MSTPEFELRSPHSLKRDRDEDDVLLNPHRVLCSSGRPPQSPLLAHTPELQLAPGSSDRPNREASPARSSTSSLTDADTATPPAAQNSPATVFSALNSVTIPPKKRARLTCAEKEERKIMKQIKERERVDEKSRKEAERRGKEENKARKDAEKEAERKMKDAEREEKRLMKEAEKAEKEKAKEDEKRRREEEKRKKEKSQPKLNVFFKIPVTSIKGQDSDHSKLVGPVPAMYSGDLISQNSSSKLPSKNLTSDYEKRFPPFFLQSNITIAPINIFQRCQSAISVLEDIIDSYICGERTLPQQQSFDAAALFNRNSSRNTRGRKCVPVSEIMTKLLGGLHRPIDLTTDSQNMKIMRTRNLLKSVPYKVLSFVEDVRPPYKGTYSKWPQHGIKKLARNPFKRDLPKVDYDYDSEAEWVADEGEDLESDGEEDEDGADDEDDLKGFIDDEDDPTTNTRKFVLQDDLEVQSTGLCFEDQNGHNPNPLMSQYCMEIIHENIPNNASIDPLSTHYWDPPVSVYGLMEPPRGPLTAMKSTSASVNGSNKTTKKLGASESSKVTKSTAASGPKKLVSLEDMPAFKQAITGSELSKIGLIEVLNKQFPKIPKTVLKATLETMARRVGSKEVDKRWVIIEDGYTA